METTITYQQMHDFITSDTFDPYGLIRCYAIWDNQIVGIKSLYYLEKYKDAARFYVVSHDPNNLLGIGKA